MNKYLLVNSPNPFILSPLPDAIVDVGLFSFGKYCKQMKKKIH